MAPNTDLIVAALSSMAHTIEQLCIELENTQSDLQLLREEQHASYINPGNQEGENDGE